MINVAVIQRRLAHYRLPLYEGIIKNNSDISLHVYCGFPEKSKGGSGISIKGEDPPYAKRIKTYTLNFFRRTQLLQPGIIWRILRERYDLVIYEGSLILLSSIVVLILRRITGGKNIIWSKGWPNAHLDGKFAQLIKSGFLRLAQSYIVYGKKSKKDLADYGIPEEKIMVAQNTVKIEHLLNRKENEVGRVFDNPQVTEIINLGYPYIFNIGRHINKKRVQDLLKVFKFLQSDQNEREIALVIAGSGPETKSLKRYSRELSLKNVFFVGTVSDRDAEELFFRSLCCVFPGEVGLALNQAMACGKPVICADEPGPDSELLVHMKNGIRYQRGNVKQMQYFLIKIIKDKNLQKKLGENARLTVEREATMEKMVESFVMGLRLAVKKQK